jgi:signal transduction histidine kinase
MAGGYVHRLNGALGFIPASIDAVIDGLSADTQDVLRDVKGGVVDALDFTKRMRDLVVYQELPQESVDINLILRAVVHRFKIPSTKVGVTWEFAPDLPEIMADKMFLTEVFNNMVLNALEAMEDKSEGELRIGGRLVDTEVVEIWLSDTGCGVTEENLPKIFEPEFTTKPGKRGLGLWFCDTVIKAHDGRIDVDSTPEKGTTFTIALPVGGG